MDPVTALPHFDHFETERAGPVAVWRINRPSKANALTAAFWPQLRGLLDAAAAQPGVRAVVLTPWPDQAGALELSNRDTITRLGDVEVALLRHVAGPDRRALASAGAGLPWRRWLDLG